MLTRARSMCSFAGMSNVLDHEQQQQIYALGRLGWTLSRIQRTTGIRRETISAYLKAAHIPVRGRGRPSDARSKPAISGEVSTDSDTPPPTPPADVSAARALSNLVSPDAVVADSPRSPRASACE